MSSPLPVYLTAAEAAAILRVKPYTVSKLCKSGAIKAGKGELQWLIKPEDLDAYINRKQVDDQDAA